MFNDFLDLECGQQILFEYIDFSLWNYSTYLHYYEGIQPRRSRECKSRKVTRTYSEGEVYARAL